MTRTYKPFVPHPCPDCPFRKDTHPFLTRARQIAMAISTNQEAFTCHKTNDGAIVTAKSRHCAGAILILEKMGVLNISMRMALILKCYNRPTGGELIFETLEEFVNHHGGANENT